MKPVLFIDFDGTLCHDKFWRSLPSETQAQVQKLIFEDNFPRAQAWMKGVYSSEDINGFIAESLGISADDLWKHFVRDCQTMQVVPGALENISLLRERFHTVLMTVNMDCFTRFTVPALGLGNYFDAISNSFYEGKFKTEDEGSIYIEYADKYSAPMGRCITIDDSPKVIELFKNLGGTALQILPEQDINFHLTQLLQYQQ